MALAAVPLQAGEPEILAAIREFFASSGATQRELIAARIIADPAYERARISAWLHAAGLFEPLAPGRTTLTVELRDGARRSIVVRIPQAYDPQRPWPLIYALHGQGGDAESIIQYTEALLGPRVEEFLVAAPDQYVEVVLHDRWPPLGEHRACLHAVRRRLHVDSDRVYVLGYSRGGHAAWTLAVTHADQFAAVIPLAGSLLLPEVEGLWDEFLPNMAHTRVLAVWGALDVMGPDGRPSPQGGISELNRRLRDRASVLTLPLRAIELPGIGHQGVRPPPGDLHAALECRRTAYPRRVRQVVRDVSHSGAYWLEGQAWRGQQWDDRPLKVQFRPDEDPLDPEVQRQAAVRAYRSRLGELRGEIDGQNIRVYRRRIADAMLWLGDGCVDWQHPITVKVNGEKVFEGTVEPDLALCLSEAARTYDFERLRWAGLHIRSGAKARIIRSERPSSTPARRP